MPKSGDGLTAHPALSFWQRRERVLSKAADEKRKLTANYLNGLAWPQPRWVFSHRLSLT